MSTHLLRFVGSIAAIIALFGALMVLPVAKQSFAAGSVDYRTHVSLQCYTSGSGEGIFQLLKNGRVLGSAILRCSGFLGKSDAYPVTEGKPLEWRLTLKLYDSSGSLVSQKTTTGKGFPGSSSLSASVFGNIDSPVRYYY